MMPASAMPTPPRRPQGRRRRRHLRAASAVRLVMAAAATLVVLSCDGTGGRLVHAWTGSDLVAHLPHMYDDCGGDGCDGGGDGHDGLNLSALFPASSVRHFFRGIYDTEVAFVNRGESSPLQHRRRERNAVSNGAHYFQSLWPSDPSAALHQRVRGIFEAFEREGQHTAKSAVSVVRPGAGYKSMPMPAGNATFDHLRTLLAGGYSFVFKFEQLRGKHAYSALEHALFNLTGLPISVHLYLSAAGEMLLEPHTDPYDVLVLQLQGEKHWHTCTPRERLVGGAGGDDTRDGTGRGSRSSRASGGGGSGGGGDGSSSAEDWAGMTTAQKCMLRELQLDKVQGCTIYSVEDTAGGSMDCSEFDLRTGDALYMPKGVVHYAQTRSDVAAHLTVGFHRGNVQWLDLVRTLVANLTSTVAASLPLLPLASGTGSSNNSHGQSQNHTTAAASARRMEATGDIGGGSDAARSDTKAASSSTNNMWLRRLLRREAADAVVQAVVRDTLGALGVYSMLDVGMHLQEAVPGWLLKCLGRAPWCSAEEAAALRRDVLLLAHVHVGRFGSWAFDRLRSRQGVAALSKPSTTMAPLPLWTGDSVLQALRLLAQQPGDYVEAAFRKLAQVTSKDDAFLRGSAKKKTKQQKTKRHGATATTVSADVVGTGTTARRGAGSRRGSSGNSALEAKRALARSFERRTFADKEAHVRWRRGGGGGGGAGEVAGAGVSGSALCDEMQLWHTECAASTDERCEVFITEQHFVGSCDAYCASQGLSCTDGYDDSSKGHCARAPKGSDCRRGEDGRFGTKICVCVRGAPAAERVNVFPAFPGNKFEVQARDAPGGRAAASFGGSGARHRG